LIEFSVHFAADGDLLDKIKFVQFSEKLGIDMVWVADENFFRDAYVLLTMIALNTSKTRIGIGCTNPYSRHPVMTAVAAATLNDVSSGRFVLTLGSGSNYDLLNHLLVDGRHHVGVCKDALKVMRPLLNGMTVTYEGKYLKVLNARLGFAPQHPTPIYLGCRGPQMLRLAGNLTDGAFLNGVPLEYMPFALGYIREGMRRAGKNLEDFVIINETGFAVSDNPDEARELVKQTMIYYFLSTPSYVLEKVGLDEKDLEPLMKAFPDMNKVGSLITDDMIDKFSVAGSPKECVNRMRAYVGAGVNHFSLCVPDGRTDILEMATREVFPKVRGT
jgi:5,10-methylenetetrahydromethanopterin reductase